MKKVLLSSCGIAAAALGAVVLSAEAAKISGTVADGVGDRSVMQGDSGKLPADLGPAGAGQISGADETKAVRIAQGGSPATATDDPDGPGDDADDKPGEAEDDDKPGATDDGEDDRRR